MPDRIVSFGPDSEKIFQVDYSLEVTKDGAVLFTNTATVTVVTKGDAIAAAVQAKIEALEKIRKDSGDVTFMVSNVLCQGERES